MDYIDFMMATVDLSNISLNRYCEKAFNLLFKNEMQQMDKQEFIDIICKQSIKKTLVELILNEIDSNHNESITFDEFVDLILKYCDPEYKDNYGQTISTGDKEKDRREIVKYIKAYVKE